MRIPIAANAFLRRIPLTWVASGLIAGCQDIGTAPAPLPTPLEMHLEFGTQPPTAVAGQPFIRGVTVRIVDVQGNLVTNDTRNVTVGLSVNPAAGLLSGTTTVAATGGVATFSSLTVDRFGYGYVLTAVSNPPLSPATSAEFGVVPASDVSFQLRVRPILVSAGCTGCHGGTSGLFVDSVPNILRGGSRGPAVVAGNSAGSLLVTKTSSTPPFGSRMPQGGAPLPDTTRWVLRAWIDQGAKDN